MRYSWNLRLCRTFPVRVLYHVIKFTGESSQADILFQRRAYSRKYIVLIAKVAISNMYYFHYKYDSFKLRSLCL